MIRPITSNEKTDLDKIESKFFKISVKKHKKQIRRGSYSDDNPIMTAGVILFILVVFMFLLMATISSKNTLNLEENTATSNSQNSELIKSDDSGEKSKSTSEIQNESSSSSSILSHENAQNTKKG